MVQKRCCRRKRQGPMAKKCCYNGFGMSFFFFSFFFFLFFLSHASSGHMLKQKSTHSFFVHGHSSWSTFGFTPKEGPKDFVNRFIQQIGPCKLDRQVGPWKRPSFLVRLHGPWCKSALRKY